MIQEKQVQQKPFQVAVIAYDEPFNPPAWLEEEFSQAGMTFSLKNCFSEQEVLDFATGKDVLLTSSARKLFTREVIEQLSTCRALVRVGSGVDCIEVPAATARGIVVINTPGALAEEVSDHAAALLLACARRISSQDRLVRRGEWRSSTLLPKQRLRGKVLGLVGFGRIARTLVEKLAGFGFLLLAYDPYVDAGLAEKWGVKMVSLDELLTEADFVSLHLSLSQETYHLLGERELRLMKRDAILINTARGAIVDQAALHTALTEEWIAGAGLDVLEQEPPSSDDPLLLMENVILTPHVAAASDELMDALYRAGSQVVIDLWHGKWPGTVVNPDVRPWWIKDEQ